MKKRILIVLLVLILMLPLWHVASANAPAPNPYESWLDYRNVPEGSTVAVMAVDADGAAHEVASTVVTAKTGRLGFMIVVEERFYVETMTEEGETAHSETILFEGREHYRFDGETGVLEKGSYLSGGCGAAESIGILLLGLVWIAAALGVTLVIELLVGLCFRMRPIRYVVIINLITNPIMNILLLILSATINSSIIYPISLVILELAVCGFEFWFYTAKYKTRRKWVLLIFTLVANAASAAAGILPVWLLLR